VRYRRIKTMTGTASDDWLVRKNIHHEAHEEHEDRLKLCFFLRDPSRSSVSAANGWSNKHGALP
ncbi:hypothetical protein, partial [Desulfatiferula olefinivorans]